MAAGAAGALIRVVAGDSNRVEAGQAQAGVKARDAGEATVDDHAHAFDGEAGLRDVRGQNHAASRSRLDRGLLRADGQVAVERPDVEALAGQVLKARAHA